MVIRTEHIMFQRISWKWHKQVRRSMEEEDAAYLLCRMLLWTPSLTLFFPPPQTLTHFETGRKRIRLLLLSLPCSFRTKWIKPSPADTPLLCSSETPPHTHSHWSTQTDKDLLRKRDENYTHSHTADFFPPILLPTSFWAVLFFLSLSAPRPDWLSSSSIT